MARLSKKQCTQNEWKRILKRFSGQHVAVPFFNSYHIIGYGDTPQEAIERAKHEGFLEAVVFFNIPMPPAPGF